MCRRFRVNTALGEGSTEIQVETTGRDAVLVEDAAEIRMMGFPILEALPSRAVYDQVDPFILVHEGRLRLSDLANVDTKHPHRGFDNLWYVIEGSASTGHSTGPGGAMERARLSEGALLALRTGRGAWHAEAIGADELEEGQADSEFRGVLFWVNLARKDKQMEPSAQVVPPEQIPARQEGDATVRVLVGEGSPVRLGTPALVLDIELPEGGEVTTRVPPEFQGFAYVLEGEAAFGANRRRARPPSSSSSVAVMSSPSPMRRPALGTWSWRGSRMGKRPCSTGRTWIRRAARPRTVGEAQVRAATF
jgi:redox-sensitive bicupin YhaK (pirin superfamily)